MYEIGRDYLCTLNPYCELPITSVAKLGNVNINIYPNPASDWLEINPEGTEKLQLELIDIQGRVLRQAHNEGSPIRWSVSELPAGAYWLRAYNNNALTIKPIIIKE